MRQISIKIEGSMIEVVKDNESFGSKIKEIFLNQDQILYHSEHSWVTNGKKLYCINIFLTGRVVILAHEDWNDEEEFEAIYSKFRECLAANSIISKSFRVNKHIRTGNYYAEYGTAY